MSNDFPTLIRRDFIKTAAAACLAPVCPTAVVEEPEENLWRDAVLAGSKPPPSGTILQVVVFHSGRTCNVFHSNAVLLSSDSVAVVVDDLDFSVEVGSRRL